MLRSGADHRAASEGGRERALAERGVRGSAGPLPYLPLLQQAFGRHDLRDVRAYVGGEAAAAAEGIGAQAYTVGDRVAFREPPDLHTAAHEAAHVLQQRRGVDLPNGVGQPADRYEQQADTAADAVVGRRPVGPHLPPTGTSRSSATAVQKKTADVADVDAIAAAGTRAQTLSGDDTRMMIAGASIVFRLLRTFYPEYLAKWHFSGVGYERDLPGIQMSRQGRNVAVTVGRAFVLDTQGRGLSSRVLEVGASLEALEGPEANRTAAQGAPRGPATMEEALREAGKFFSDKALFGLTAGAQAGPDPSDAYDARYWKESGRSIEAIVEPWIAMSQMVAHLDDPVPKAGGGTTRWRFDCFEGAEVERHYADWRMQSREEFNKKNTPLKIGFLAFLFDRMKGTRPDYYKAPVKADRKGGPTYREGEEQVVRMPSGEYKNIIPRIPVGKPMKQVLEEAPVGSWVIFTNADVKRKLAAFDKRKTTGPPLTAAEEAFVARVNPWENENCLKVGKDRYAAFPFGVVDEQTIAEGMAKVVFEPNPVPPGYIAQNIYISAISEPK